MQITLIHSLCRMFLHVCMKLKMLKNIYSRDSKILYNMINSDSDDAFQMIFFSDINGQGNLSSGLIIRMCCAQI